MTTFKTTSKPSEVKQGTQVRHLYIGDTFTKEGITRKIVDIFDLDKTNIVGLDTYIVSKKVYESGRVSKTTLHDYFRLTDEVTLV